MENQINQWKNHVILYSKGHYLESDNTLTDLKKIAKTVGLPDGPISVIQLLADVTLWAMKELAKQPRYDVLRGQTIPNTFTHEFIDWIGFIFRNKTEVAQKVRTQRMGYIEDPANLIECMEFVMAEQLLKGLLVVIAKVDPREMELPEPTKEILPVRETKKGKSHG